MLGDRFRFCFRFRLASGFGVGEDDRRAVFRFLVAVVGLVRRFPRVEDATESTEGDRVSSIVVATFFFLLQRPMGFVIKNLRIQVDMLVC